MPSPSKAAQRFDLNWFSYFFLFRFFVGFGFSDVWLFMWFRSLQKTGGRLLGRAGWWEQCVWMERLHYWTSWYPLVSLLSDLVLKFGSFSNILYAWWFCVGIHLLFSVFEIALVPIAVPSLWFWFTGSVFVVGLGFCSFYHDSYVCLCVSFCWVVGWFLSSDIAVWPDQYPSNLSMSALRRDE